MKKRGLIILAATFAVTTSACAQPAGSGQPEADSSQKAGTAGGATGPGSTSGGGYGPGMMGGYGGGMMGGYGPGMMGGYGGGMMGGYGGGWGLNAPDLTDEQRSKISAIQKEFRQKQWALMEQMHENSASGNFYRNGKLDEQAARKAYDTTASLHKQMFENRIEMQKRIDEILTPSQREQLQRGPRGR